MFNHLVPLLRQLPSLVFLLDHNPRNVMALCGRSRPAPQSYPRSGRQWLSPRGSSFANAKTSSEPQHRPCQSAAEKCGFVDTASGPARRVLPPRPASQVWHPANQLGPACGRSPRVAVGAVSAAPADGIQEGQELFGQLSPGRRNTPGNSLPEMEYLSWVFGITVEMERRVPGFDSIRSSKGSMNL